MSEQQIFTSPNEIVIRLEDKINRLQESLDSIRIFVDAYYALEKTGESNVCGTMINAIQHILDMTDEMNK